MRDSSTERPISIFKCYKNNAREKKAKKEVMTTTTQERFSNHTCVEGKLHHLKTCSLHLGSLKPERLKIGPL